MSWSLTINGHIGTAEAERSVVEKLRQVVRALNADGTVFASYAKVVTSNYGTIDLLKEPSTAGEEFAQPFVTPESESEVKEVPKTEKVVDENEVMAARDSEAAGLSENNVETDETTGVDESKSQVKSLDDLTGKSSTSAAKSSPTKATKSTK